MLHFPKHAMFYVSLILELRNIRVTALRNFLIKLNSLLLNMGT